MLTTIVHGVVLGFIASQLFFINTNLSRILSEIRKDRRL
jgi:hypothetical protein